LVRLTLSLFRVPAVFFKLAHSGVFHSSSPGVGSRLERRGLGSSRQTLAPLRRRHSPCRGRAACRTPQVCGPRSCANGIGHVQADALLADNDRTNVDRRCELDEMIDEIPGENLDAFAYDDRWARFTSASLRRSRSVNTRSNRGDGEILDVQGVFPREGAAWAPLLSSSRMQCDSSLSSLGSKPLSKSHGSRRPTSRRTLLVRPRSVAALKWQQRPSG